MRYVCDLKKICLISILSSFFLTGCLMQQTASDKMLAEKEDVEASDSESTDESSEENSDSQVASNKHVFDNDSDDNDNSDANQNTKFNDGKDSDNNMDVEEEEEVVANDDGPLGRAQCSYSIGGVSGKGKIGGAMGGGSVNYSGIFEFNKDGSVDHVSGTAQVSYVEDVFSVEAVVDALSKEELLSGSKSGGPAVTCDFSSVHQLVAESENK